MSEPAVAQAIERVVAAFPELEPLLAHLQRNQEGYVLSPEFLTAYAASPVPYGRRSQVLRALLCDETLFRKPLTDRLTVPLIRRVVTFLEALPSQPLRTGLCLQQEVPKPLLRLFGVRDATVRGFLDHVLPALWQHATGQPVRSPAGAAPGLDDEKVLAALRPLLDARLLDITRCAELVRDGFSSATAAYYFGTAVDAISIRNLLLFLGVLLDGDRRGGRIQNRIPLQLGRRFKLTPRSIPDALVIADVLTLLHDGVLALPESDPLGIGRVFDQPVPAGFWQPALAAHRHRPLVHPGYNDVIDGVDGMFDSSLRFNLCRATGLLPGKAARMARFAPYYRSLSLPALLAQCLPHWTAISPSLERRARQLANDARFNAPALRVRDLCNILALVAHTPPEDLVLPPVARFALGEAEPQATGTGTRQQRRRAPLERRPVDLAPVKRLQQQLDARSTI